MEGVVDLPPEKAFATIQAHCMAKEDAVEDYPWEHVGWKIRDKLFCIGTQDQNVITVKSTPDKQAGLIAHPDIEVAAYVGRYGWVTITISDSDTLEVALDLIDESYDLVKPKRRKSAAKE
jgi:predicted DNA-binding protein (MmcQ/YjbR family)